MLLQQISRSIRQLPAGRRALALVWQATRGWTLLWMFLLIVQGLLPAGLAILLRSLVNRLAHVPNGREAIYPALGIALLWLVGVILTSALSLTRTIQAEKVQDLVYKLIHEKTLRLDLSFFDQAESYDLLHRARVDAAAQPLALLESLGTLLQNSIGFLVLTSILWTYAFWLPLLLLASGVPGLVLVARHILQEHRWNMQHTNRERRIRYLDWMLTDQSTAAELRVYGLGPYFRQDFEHLRDWVRNGHIDLARQGAGVELCAGSLAWAGSLAGLGWMLYRTVTCHVGLGDLLFCFQASQQSQAQLRALLEGAGKIFRSLLFIENLELFLKQETKMIASAAVSPSLPVQQSICFEKISKKDAKKPPPAPRPKPVEPAPIGSAEKPKEKEPRQMALEQLEQYLIRVGNKAYDTVDADRAEDINAEIRKIKGFDRGEYRYHLEIIKLPGVDVALLNDDDLDRLRDIEIAKKMATRGKAEALLEKKNAETKTGASKIIAMRLTRMSNTRLRK